MATKLFCKQFQNSQNLTSAYYYASLTASVLPLTSLVTNKINGTTQQTIAAGGAVRSWISPPLAVAVTISGTITYNAWVKTSSTTGAPKTIGRVYKYSGGTETQFSTKTSTLTQTTAIQQDSFTAAPTSTTFARGDRIVVKWWVSSTSATGTETLDYGGLTASADGDTWVQFTESLVFQAEPEAIQVINFSGGTGNTISAAFSGVNAAGNTILAYGVLLEITNTMTCAGTTSGAFTGLTSNPTNWNSGGNQSWIFLCENIAGGTADTLTVTKGTSDTALIGFDAIEWAGVAAVSLDVYPSAGNFGSGTAVTSNNTPVTNYPDDVVVAIEDDNFSVSFTPGAGFTQRNGFGGEGAIWIDQAVSATGVYSASGTGNDSATWFMQILTLRAKNQNYLNTQTAALPGFSGTVARLGKKIQAAIMAPMGATLAKLPGKVRAASMAVFSGAMARFTAMAEPVSLSWFAGNSQKQTGASEGAVMATFPANLARGIGAAAAGIMALCSSSVSRSMDALISSGMGNFSASRTGKTGISGNAQLPALAGAAARLAGKAVNAAMVLFTSAIATVAAITHLATISAALGSFSATMARLAEATRPAAMDGMAAEQAKTAEANEAAGISTFAAGASRTIAAAVAASINIFAVQVSRFTKAAAGAAMGLFSGTAVPSAIAIFLVSASAALAAFSASFARAAGKSETAALAAMAATQERSSGKSQVAEMSPWAVSIGRGFAATIQAAMAFLSGTLSRPAALLVAAMVAIVPSISIFFKTVLSGLDAVAVPDLQAIFYGIIPALAAGGGQQNMQHCQSSLTAWVLNDQFIVVFGLARALQAPSATPDWVTDATGTANVYDTLGNPVAGPLAFVYVAGPVVMPNGSVSPDGNYLAALSSDFNPPTGNTYVCKITLASGSGGVYHVEDETTVQVRS